MIPTKSPYLNYEGVKDIFIELDPKKHNVVAVEMPDHKNYIFELPIYARVKKGNLLKVKNKKGKELIVVAKTNSFIVSEENDGVMDFLLESGAYLPFKKVLGMYTDDKFIYPPEDEEIVYFNLYKVKFMNTNQEILIKMPCTMDEEKENEIKNKKYVKFTFGTSVKYGEIINKSNPIILNVDEMISLEPYLSYGPYDKKYKILSTLDYVSFRYNEKEGE